MYLCFFIISDEEIPTFDYLYKNISVPTNIGKDFATLNWTEPNATDNSGVVTVSSSNTPGLRFYIGSTNVTYTAIDPSGNRATSTFKVTVIGQCLGSVRCCAYSPSQ